MPLVSYADEAQAPHFVHSIFEGLRQSKGFVYNSYRVMAHNPDALRAFAPCVGAILKEHALPNRLKELAILKVTLINGCRY